MAKLRLAPAFQYCLRDSVRGLLIFIGIMVLVHIVLTGSIVLFAQPNTSAGTVSIYGAAAAIALFVTGIVTVREHLRLLIQHGIGRRTAFITQIGLALSLAVVAALAEQLINWLSLLILSGSVQIEYTTFYQMTFGHNQPLSGFGNILASIAVSLMIYFSAYLMGMLISLIFYRLPKFWKLVVAIGVPVFFTVVLPLLAGTSAGFTLLRPLGVLLMKLMEFAVSSAGSYLLVSLAWSLLLAAGCLLLMRRAPIK